VDEDTVDPIGVFSDLVLGSREHPDKDAIDRFDAFEGGLEGLVGSTITDAAGRQDIEREAWLAGLAHDLVHLRRIALQVGLTRNSSVSPFSTFFHSSRVRVRLYTQPA